MVHRDRQIRQRSGVYDSRRCNSAAARVRCCGADNSGGANMIPVRQAAKQLGISHERMRQYIRAGRVPGAERDATFGHWLVPAQFVVLPPTKKQIPA